MIDRWGSIPAMCRILCVLVAACLLETRIESRAAPQADLRALAPAIEKNLTTTIIGFWYPKSIDREYGGYLIDFDATGRFKGRAPKMIVTQARMVWLSSRLVREGRGGADMREYARQGYRFLMDHMWDAEHGGFYWEVDRAGANVIAPDKHLYGQSFGLYALSEYARATGDPKALADATTLFNLLEARAHDTTYGGYVEFFGRDWSPEPADVMPYLGVPHGVKTMNTHLHLMEALTAFYRASHLPLAATRLAELITIQSNTVVRKSTGACTDQYARDWTPQLTGDAARASYGHDLENIWLLVDAHDALGLPIAPQTDLFRALFAYALAHGYDRQAGGFYDNGPLGADADHKAKTWWVQAESLVSALTMYRLTGDAQYADVFRKTWQFVNERQTDWTSGEWFESVAADGTTAGDKAHRWKAGYHNGRALLECLRLLSDARSP
jgi:mannobiose 2-epimerase